MRNLLSSGSGLAQQQASVLGSGTDVNQLGSATAAMLPYLVPGLAAYYDFTTTSLFKADASNRVSFVRDVSGNSGTLGLVLPGTSGNYASTPSAAPVQITGDIDLRAMVAFNNIASGAYQVIAAKDLETGAAATRSYEFGINPTGSIFGQFSVNGSTPILVASTAAISTAGFSNYSVGWIRVTRASASGNCNFYTSTDGTNWTLLGSANVSGTSGSLFNCSYPLWIGINQQGSSGTVGTIYRAQIYNGIAGTLAFDANFSAQTYGLSNAATFVESSSNAATVTINGSGALGARIAGARDLAMLTGSAQPLLLPWSGTNYGYLPGVSGNYFSTPDSAAVSITGDIDLRVYVAMDDWTPASNQNVFTKWGTAGQNSWLFGVRSDGLLEISWSANGTTSINKASTAAPTVSDFGGIWIRVTLDVDNGAAGNTVTFYTSADGTTWTQLGNTVTTAGTTSIFDGTSVVQVSGRDATNGHMAGRVFRAQIYNGIAGTLAFDANFTAVPNNATSFTESSANGATVTVNSTGSKPAQVVGKQSLLFDGSAYYLKTAAFTLNQPTTVYLVGKQNTWVADAAITDGNSATESLVFYQPSSSTTPNTGIYAGTAPLSFVSLTLKTNGVLVGVFNGASSSERLNRNAAASVSIGTRNGNGFTIGAGYGGLNPSAVQFCYALIFAAAHDTATQDRIIQYLGKQAGITV